MKTVKIITASVFAVVIFGLSALCIFLPKNDYSDSERRYLKAFPELSLETLISGRFMSGFEDYALDNFPFRDTFRSIKAAVSLKVFGRLDNNDIYEHNGYITETEYPLDEKSIDRAAKIFKKINDDYLTGKNANVYFSLIPDKNYFLAKKSGHLSIDYEKMVSSIKSKTDFMTYVDIFPLLSIEDYYKTDTHWKQESIVDVAEYIAKAMGADVKTEYKQNQLAKPFYGVYYGQYALPLEAEKITYLTNETLENCVVYDGENRKNISVYDMEKANGKDPYEIYLSGPISYITIENPDAETDKELVIFRDSFGSSIAPLMAEGYSKITLVDIRYVFTDIVCKMVDFENADVLFLYSAIVLNNSDTFK